MEYNSKTERQHTIDFYVRCFECRHYRSKPSDKEIESWCKKNTESLDRSMRRKIEKDIKKRMEDRYASH